MRSIDGRDITMSLKDTQAVCLSVSEAYTYVKGKRTDTTNGYRVEAFFPKLDAVASVRVPDVPAEVKPMKRIVFDDLTVRPYSPAAWEVRWTLSASAVQAEVRS